MAIQRDAPELTADLWFVASMDSAKMREIEERPSVCVTCLRGSGSAYISISADARVRRDPALVRKLFQSDWKLWWPDGPDDPSITFIEMTVIRAEYWEPAGGKVRILYEMMKSLVKGEPGDANLPPPKKM
jgi:general stress protein 26